jgi:hypothetical protein
MYLSRTSGVVAVRLQEWGRKLDLEHSDLQVLFLCCLVVRCERNKSCLQVKGTAHHEGLHFFTYFVVLKDLLGNQQYLQMDQCQSYYRKFQYQS